ncbi:hypothetical protein L596_013668 [Steinernema carpocapsae]|uniref:Reverse transcriptase domain-containing protein n=1 Tax=Steinernema carpocapsae TaxID=34508 RepID=A0A4U5P0V0_STECR|nr:hypothetical protein L596_013668 [Steinernema carpocapsae]
MTPDKETTKCRVVMDGSGAEKDKYSINDVLQPGAADIPDLCTILLLFRAEEFGIIADVEKAFLQLLIRLADRDALRFRTFVDVNKPLTPDNLVDLRFTRVPFGLTQSPFLLSQALKHQLAEMADQHLAKELHNQTYVDNVVVTRRSEEDAVKFYETTKEFYGNFGMNLRAFQSNSKRLMEHVKEKDKAQNDIQKVLGVKWTSTNDTLNLEIKIPDKKKVTKRSTMQQYFSIFDPMGFLIPATLNMKVFIQELWKHDISWDKPLEPQLAEEWQRLIKEAEGFQKNLPRCAWHNTQEAATLIVCSDASKSAMATCAYLVGNATSHLVMAKSILPKIQRDPEMTPSMPKLEMTALTEGAHLAVRITESLKDKITINKVILLSDSEIALAWAKTDPKRCTQGRAVKNRIMDIRKARDQIALKNATTMLGYINTDCNPADCATRGLTREELQNHIWWTGAKYFTDSLDEWPKRTALFELPCDKEEEDKVNQPLQHKEEEKRPPSQTIQTARSPR